MAISFQGNQASASWRRRNAVPVQSWGPGGPGNPQVGPESPISRSVAPNLPYPCSKVQDGTPAMAFGGPVALVIAECRFIPPLPVGIPKSESITNSHEQQAENPRDGVMQSSTHGCKTVHEPVERERQRNGILFSLAYRWCFVFSIHETRRLLTGADQSSDLIGACSF